MSNYLAVATATETIAQVIRDALAPVSGAQVTTNRPDRAARDAAAHVNVYLYQVTPNAALRNTGLPLRHGDGTLASRPRTALDLYYLISFYGPDEQLVAQQLMGLTAAALHLHARLTRQDVLRAVQAAPGGFLNDSNLAEQGEPINVSQNALTLEELSKLWSVMFQVPYTLSMPYQCSVVVIDGDAVPAALPVRAVAAAVRTGRGPVVQSVSAGAPGRPIVAGSRVVIRGSGLGGAATTVVIGDVVLTPAPGDVSDTRVAVALTDSRLEAGPAALSVSAGGVASAPARFVLAPTLAAVRLRKGTAKAPAALRLTVNPPVWSIARVTVLLNATGAGGSAPPPDYAFDLPQPPATQPPRRVSTLTVPIPGVAPGSYLVRVRVNGVESPLSTRRAAGGTVAYAAPRVRVP